VLGRIELPEVRTPEDATTYPALLNLVTGEPDEQPRKLPTVWFGKTPFYTDRDLRKVEERLQYMAEATFFVPERTTYMLNACRIDGRVGLYGQDFHNRSFFRTKLQRHGMEFAHDPFTTFNPSGAFECSDWGEFKPTFVILRNAADYTDDPVEIIELKGAALAFQLTAYRLGMAGPTEISQLVRLVKGVGAVSALTPEPVARALASTN
jgi:hypothetical protein